MGEQEENRDATLMVIVSVISSVIIFLMFVFLGRSMGPEAFQEYAIAIAELMLLASICEFGTGKYALRIVPEYVDRHEWNLASGYWRFSIGMALAASLLATAVVVLSEYAFDGKYGNYEIGVAVLFLPATALVSVVAELTMANRAAVAGTVVKNLVLPATTFGLLGLTYWSFQELSFVAAVNCFGGSAIIGLVVAAVLFWRTSPRRSFQTQPSFHTIPWLKYCAWYALLAFLMSWVFRISIILLDAAKIPEIEVARFAAALETGSFILLVARSTNKFYQPELALIMSQGDWKRAARMQHSRRILVGSACLVYLLAMLVFGKTILGWFGADFVDGYPALCFITVGNCLVTLFAMAPEYLKFAGRLKTVLAINSIAGLVLITLTWFLAIEHGATGAGLAFGITVGLMALTFLFFSSRQLNSFKKANSAT